MCPSVFEGHTKMRNIKITIEYDGKKFERMAEPA